MSGNRCPWCGELVDEATPAAPETVEPETFKPTPGDVSLCIYCGEWGVFAPDLSLRQPTDAEFASIAADELCRKLRRVWLAVQSCG